MFQKVPKNQNVIQKMLENWEWKCYMLKKMLHVGESAIDKKVLCVGKGDIYKERVFLELTAESIFSSKSTPSAHRRTETEPAFHLQKAYLAE